MHGAQPRLGDLAPDAAPGPARGSVGGASREHRLTGDAGDAVPGERLTDRHRPPPHQNVRYCRCPGVLSTGHSGQSAPTTKGRESCAAWRIADNTMLRAFWLPSIQSVPPSTESVSRSAVVRRKPTRPPITESAEAWAAFSNSCAKSRSASGGPDKSASHPLIASRQEP